MNKLKSSVRRKRVQTNEKFKHAKAYRVANNIIKRLSNMQISCVIKQRESHVSESVYILISIYQSNIPPISIRVSAHPPSSNYHTFDVYITSPRENAYSPTEIIKEIIVLLNRGG